jgi:DNA-binding transcriptional LysR family regulator
MALSHLRFRHLMLIDTLVARGTLHKAAQQLHISQPAATAMLNDLEALLGIGLFTRSRQGVTPTPATLALLDKARTLLNGFDDFAQAVQRMAEGRDVRLRVGVVPQAFADFMPRAIERFRASGGCAISTLEGTAAQLLEALLSGRLDGVVGRLPSDELPYGHRVADLDLRPLYSDDVLVVVRPGHALLQRQPLTPAMLAQAPWVLQRRDSSVRRALVESFLRRGLTPPDPEVETASYVQNLAIVTRSNLLSIAPRRAAERSQAQGLVEIVPFDLEIEPMHVSFITRKESADHGMLQRFREAMLWAVQSESDTDLGGQPDEPLGGCSSST